MIFRSLNKVQGQSESDIMHIRYIISRYIKIKDKLERLYLISIFS